MKNPTHPVYPISTYIYFSEDTRATYVDLPVYIGSVPTEHLDNFDEKFTTSLKRIIDEGFDMDRMAMVIGRDERQVSVIGKVRGRCPDTLCSFAASWNRLKVTPSPAT